MNTYQLSNSTAIDRIRLFYTEDMVLSREDSQLKDRIETAHTLMLSDFETDRNAVSILMKRFDISKATAYRDLGMAITLFGKLRQSDKDGLRYMVTQWAIELFKMSHKLKNLKGMEKAMERITKANNLDKEDMDLPDASKIQPPVQLLSVNFNFINSPMFKLIDEAAQQAMLKQYDEFMQHVNISPMAEYLDIWKIDDSARPNKD